MVQAEAIQLFLYYQTVSNLRFSFSSAQIPCIPIRLAFLSFTDGDAMVTNAKSTLGVYSDVRDFFLKDIWMLRLGSMPRWKAASIRLLRVWTVAVREFFVDQCALRASALTFYTLL